MMSSKQNLLVNPIFCETCDENSCFILSCKICPVCLQPNDLYDLHATYREHMHKGNFKRIIPAPINNEMILKKMSPKNRKLSLWVYGKCLEDKSWC